MQLLDIAERHRGWLAQRQSAVGQNIANVNTPNYVARAVSDFSELLTGSDARLATTNFRHIGLASASSSATVIQPETGVSTHSGNNVDLDRELLQAGEVRAGYALNVSMVKTFNRMLQAVMRS